MKSIKFLAVCVSLLLIGAVGGYFYTVPAIDAIAKGGGSGGSFIVQNGPWRSYTNLGKPELHPALKAVVARIGMGALTSEEAVYWLASEDSEQQKLDAARSYKVSFDPIPLNRPGGFWSLSLYGPDHYYVPNEAGINSLGTRDNLKKNEDGSFDIVVSTAKPEAGMNWLPAPKSGGFSLTLRYYVPLENMLETSADIPLPSINKIN